MPDMPPQPASGIPSPQPPGGNPPNLLSQQAFVLPGAEPPKAASPMPTPQMPAPQMPTTPMPQTAAPMAMGDGPKSHKGLVIGLVAFVIIAGAAAYYFFFMTGAKETPAFDVVESAETTEPAVSDESSSESQAVSTGDDTDNAVAGEADSLDAEQETSKSDSAPSDLENSEESPLNPDSSEDTDLTQEEKNAAQSAAQQEPSKELDAPAAEGPSGEPSTSTEDSTAKFFTTGTTSEGADSDQPQSSFAKRKVPRKQ